MRAKQRRVLSAIVLLACVVTTLSFATVPTRASYFGVMGLPNTNWLFTSTAYSSVNIGTPYAIWPYRWSHTFTIKTMDLTGKVDYYTGAHFTIVGTTDPYSRILDVYVNGVLQSEIIINPGGTQVYVWADLGWFSTASLTFTIHWGYWQHAYLGTTCLDSWILQN